MNLILSPRLRDVRGGIHGDVSAEARRSHPKECRLWVIKSRSAPNSGSILTIPGGKNVEFESIADGNGSGFSLNLIHFGRL